MISHRFAVALAGAALIALLSGCASPTFDQTTATQLQESVVSVAESAAAGDFPGAVAELDELQTELDAAIEADLVTAARAARIQAAINVVRADLDVLVAPAAPATEPTPPTEPIDTGGAEDSGNGNSGKNSNGNSGNGNGNGKENGKKDK